MHKKIYLHPLPVRVWHCINAVGVVTMLLTGLQLRYHNLIDLIPFRKLVFVHNWTGAFLICNYFIWLLYYVFSDKTCVYHAELSPSKHFRESMKQLQFYAYGVYLGHQNPHQPTPYKKFNPMQSMTYQVIMFFLLPTVYITGILLWDVKQFPEIVELVGGVRVLDALHVLVFIFFAFFIPFHIYLGTLGHTPTAHFKAMFVDGYEEVEEHASSKTTSGSTA